VGVNPFGKCWMKRIIRREAAMTEYIPSPREWVAEQVELYVYVVKTNGIK
jgi:hypothetical protein